MPVSSTVSGAPPLAPGSRDAEALTRIRSRLLKPMPNDGRLAWLLTVLITLGAGILRFWHLTRPTGSSLKSVHGLVFDEVYYVHDSFSLLNYGVETTHRTSATQPCTKGFSICPSFIVHPPLGKWMMAAGEWLFDHHRSITLQIANNPGHTPTTYPADTFSFRVASAVCGTLAVLFIIRAARRLFRSTVLGCVAGLLLSLDGLEYVESRTGLLDIFILFWVTASFAALIADRDWTRRKLAARLTRPLNDGELGPWLGFRPWRWAAGLMLGCAAAVKWSGGYYLIAWIILTLVWDYSARKECYHGARGGVGSWSPFKAAVVKDGFYSFLPLVLLPALVYIFSWTGWYLAGPNYAYDWAWDNPNHTQNWLSYHWHIFRGWIHYQNQIWQFSKTLDSGHPYRSRPWGWLLMTRPIAYFYNQNFQHPTALCGVKATASAPTPTCSQEVIALGNPAIWWTSIIAFIACGWRWLGRRDWRGLAVLLPFLAGYLPWCYLDIHAVPNSGGLHRTMFFYYMVPNVPFMVLAVTMLVGLMLGTRISSSLSPDVVKSARAPTVSGRRIGGLIGASGYLALVIALFAYFYPILAAEPIPYSSYQNRLWFQQCSNAPSYHHNAAQTQENGPCWF